MLSLGHNTAQIRYGTDVRRLAVGAVTVPVQVCFSILIGRAALTQVVVPRLDCVPLPCHMAFFINPFIPGIGMIFKK